MCHPARGDCLASLKTQQGVATAKGVDGMETRGLLGDARTHLASACHLPCLLQLRVVAYCKVCQQCNL